MSLRTALLPALDQIRSILGPTTLAGGPGLDLRPTSINIVKRVWQGGRRGSNGGFTDTVFTALPSYTKVRQITQREIDGSGGRFEQGDLVIGPISPTYTNATGGTSGFTEAQLAPPGQTGLEYIYRTALQAGSTGIAGDFTLIELRRDRVFRFMLYVRKLRTSPSI